MKTAAVIGASANPEKFGNRAVRSFVEKGFKVFPVNQKEETIESLPVFKSILDIPEPLNLVTVYLPPDIVLTVLEEIAEKGCDELWLNPGSESDEAVEKAQMLGLDPIVACSIIGT